MNGAPGGGKTEISAPMVYAAAILIAAGVCASVWTVWQTLRAPPAVEPVAFAPATSGEIPAASDQPPAARPQELPLVRGGEFATDFELMRQRAQTARATAEVLRRAAQANPAAAWPAEQIKAVECGEVAIR